MTDGSYNRRTFLRRTAGVGSLAVTTPVVSATNATALSTDSRQHTIAKVIRTEQFRAVRDALRKQGFRPSRGDATAQEITNTGTGATGKRVTIPFESKDARTARVIGFIDDQEIVRISGGVWRDKELLIQYYSDASVAESSKDGVQRSTHVPPHQLDENVDPSEYRRAQRDRVSSLALSIPGYDYVGTYSLDDICWTVAGACFGLFLASLVDPVPGDEAFVGTGCSVTGGACWIIDTAKRYSWCSDPDIVLYKPAWWNPIGPDYVGYPTC